MAYFSPSVLKWAARGRPRSQQTARKGGARAKAAKKFGLELSILKKIGRLTSENGGEQEARTGEGIAQELTQRECGFSRKRAP